MPELHPKNKIVEIVLVYGNVIVFAVIFTILQMQFNTQPPLLFWILFLLTLIVSYELFGIKSAIFASFLFIFLQLAQGHFTQASGYLLLSMFYFAIRYLSLRNIERVKFRERHFRTLINVSLQPMIIKDKNGDILFASNSIEELLGVKKGKIYSKNISNFVHPDDKDIYTNFFKQLQSTPNIKQSSEFRINKNNNGWIWVRNDAVNLLKYPSVNAIVSTLQDITLQRNIDQQKTEILANEKEARSLAEKALHDRDEFLSIASHELKTPLTTILLQLQATLRKLFTQSLAEFSGRDLLDSLQIAEKQSQKLSMLIQDLLNFSMASTGRLDIKPESIDIVALVNSIIQRYSEEIKLSKCKVVTKFSQDQLFGHWDPVRLEQAITNLLMNALKYAAGKKVTIKVEQEGNWALLKVTDTGKGIPVDMQEVIFEPFQRGNSDSTTKGLGVGLFITKHIAISHGGDISIKSQPARFTTFTLKLPLNNPTPN